MVHINKTLRLKVILDFSIVYWYVYIEKKHSYILPVTTLLSNYYAGYTS
jgi:hypothetical protein